MCQILSENEVRTKLSEIKNFHNIFVSRIIEDEIAGKQFRFYFCGEGYVFHGISTHKILINPRQTQIILMRITEDHKVESFISKEIQECHNSIRVTLVNKDRKEIKISITYNM